MVDACERGWQHADINKTHSSETNTLIGSHHIVSLWCTAQFLSAQLGRKRVFVYLNSAFTPSYDESVANLYAWHGVEGKLVVNYALQQAWG